MLCILFSGISFEVSSADTSALYAVKAEAHILDTVEVLSANRDVCTNELIGVRTYNTASVREACTNTKENGRTAIVQMAQMPFASLSAFMSEMLSAQVAGGTTCNATVIVGYIHQKDGKKA